MIGKSCRPGVSDSKPAILAQAQNAALSCVRPELRRPAAALRVVREMWQG
jgi:hypothetical protein